MNEEIPDYILFRKACSFNTSSTVPNYIYEIEINAHGWCVLGNKKYSNSKFDTFITTCINIDDFMDQKITIYNYSNTFYLLKKEPL